LVLRPPVVAGHRDGPPTGGSSMDVVYGARPGVPPTRPQLHVAGASGGGASSRCRLAPARQCRSDPGNSVSSTGTAPDVTSRKGGGASSDSPRPSSRGVDARSTGVPAGTAGYNAGPNAAPPACA